MPKKLTPEEVEEKIANSRDKTFKMKDKNQYKNSKSKITLIHNCGQEIDVIYDKFMSGRYSCPKCNPPKSNKQPYDKFLESLPERTLQNVEIIGDYKTSKEKIKCRCKICNKEYETTPDLLKRGCIHFECSYTDRKQCKPKKHEDFIKEIYDLVGDDYTVLDTYIRREVPIRFKCNKCGRIFKCSPNHFKSLNRRCLCGFLSKGEKRIFEYLKEKNLNFELEYSYEDCKDINKLRFDFKVILENNNYFLIEYDGKQHFNKKNDFGKENHYENLIKHDNMKNNYCEENNIKLLRIPYTQYNNIEKIIDEYLETFND